MSESKTYGLRDIPVGDEGNWDGCFAGQWYSWDEWSRWTALRLLRNITFRRIEKPAGSLDAERKLAELKALARKLTDTLMICDYEPRGDVAIMAVRDAALALEKSIEL